MKTILKISSLVLLLATIQISAVAQDKPQNQITKISYNVPSGTPYPLSGSSNQLFGEIEYDDTTGVIENFSFEVFLNSFIDDYAVRPNSFIAWLGGASVFPNMSFESNRIKVNDDVLDITGRFYFRGQYRSVNIQAKRFEDENQMQFQGQFTIYPRDYVTVISPYYRLPSRVNFDFNINFAKEVE